MNKDLFLAILSMDSYNRNYGQGLNGLFVPSFDANGNATAVVKIGNAKISRDSSSITLNGNRQDIPAGFYAIAYDMTGVAGFADGERVISYRGTDNISVFGNGDIVNGWFVGGGAQGNWAGAQAPLAIEFYKAVVGVNANGQFTANPFSNNITLTGHSLGGGLAGYVASLYGRRAGIYDNMPFELASEITRDQALNGDSGPRGNVRDFVYGQYGVEATRTIYPRQSKRAIRVSPRPSRANTQPRQNQTLRQFISHKGTKTRRRAAASRQPCRPSPVIPHPVMLNSFVRCTPSAPASYYFDVGSKILKRVQDDGVEQTPPLVILNLFQDNEQLSHVILKQLCSARLLLQDDEQGHQNPGESAPKHCFPWHRTARV